MDAWKGWVRESFADAVSVVTVGAATMWAIAELEERPAADDLALRPKYPPPRVRLALIDALLARTGIGRPAWLADAASGLLGRALDESLPEPWSHDTEVVATALLSCDLGGATLGGIAKASTAQLAPGRQADGWAAELRRSEPPSPVAHPDAARLCVAGAVAAAAQLTEEVDRARLAANLRAVLGECRPPETPRHRRRHLGGRSDRRACARRW